MSRIGSPERLAALRATGVMDTLPELAFDRLTQVASKLTGSPVAAMTLLDDQRQFLKSTCGIGEPLGTTRQTTLEESLCLTVARAMRRSRSRTARTTPGSRTTAPSRRTASSRISACR